MKTKSYERLTVETRKADAIRAALVDGLKRGNVHEKWYDRAVTVIVALEDAGFKIVNIPRKDGILPGLKNPPAPCLCGDYGPHTGCVDPGHWGLSTAAQAEHDAITAVADHQYGPVPNCQVCDHPLTDHGSDGCKQEECGCSCFESPPCCTDCGEHTDPGTIRCPICDEKWMRKNEK